MLPPTVTQTKKKDVGSKVKSRTSQRIEAAVHATSSKDGEETTEERNSGPAKDFNQAVNRSSIYHKRGFNYHYFSFIIIFLFGLF